MHHVRQTVTSRFTTLLIDLYMLHASWFKHVQTINRISSFMLTYVNLVFPPGSSQLKAQHSSVMAEPEPWDSCTKLWWMCGNPGNQKKVWETKVWKNSMNGGDNFPERI